jgi:hypothetical protein
MLRHQFAITTTRVSIWGMAVTAAAAAYVPKSGQATGHRLLGQGASSLSALLLLSRLGIVAIAKVERSLRWCERIGFSRNGRYAINHPFHRAAAAQSTLRLVLPARSAC